MKHILHIVLVLILSIGCFQGFAQTPSDTILVGKNVRIQTHQGHDIRGVITAENEVHLHIKLGNNTVVTVAKINVRRIDFLDEQPIKPNPDSLFQGNHKMYFLNYAALPFEPNSGQFDVSSFGVICMSMNLSKRFSFGARYLFFNALDFSGMFNLKLKEHFYAGIHFGWLARYTSFSQSNFDKDDWGFNINVKFTVGTSQKNFTVGM